ncbi:MAG: alpha-hydroxy-acid oxidizing protein [Actinobacteria bacterium]|nr:alpha-hydroxy-acid oxidizing protein [Actinomycetota bacterium]
MEPRLVTLADFERRAEEVLPPPVFDYYAGGAGDERTIRENRAAFAEWRLRPRVLVNVSACEPETTVLGRPVSFPVLVAPTALQRMAHPEGEVTTARAAAAAGTVMILSTLASSTIEEVAEAADARWFQLYVQRDRGLTAELVQRAHAAGYSAIVLTVDLPVVGVRDRDERNSFSVPEGIGYANLRATPPSGVAGSELKAFVGFQIDPSVEWSDVEWIRSLSPLPLVIKGVVTAEDATRSVDVGAAGIVVSNHGGRQLDGTIPSLEALPEVVDAVAGGAEVYLDGGVRRGTDVLVALALGARAVLVGRPVLWGLAVDGEAGVGRVLQILRSELETAMALSGCRAVSDIDGSLVRAARRSL